MEVLFLLPVLCCVWEGTAFVDTSVPADYYGFNEEALFDSPVDYQDVAGEKKKNTSLFFFLIFLNF